MPTQERDAGKPDSFHVYIYKVMKLVSNPTLTLVGLTFGPSATYCYWTPNQAFPVQSIANAEYRAFLLKYC